MSSLGPGPTVSVVIPCRNPSWTFELTLGSLEGQRLQLPFEVVVVDDHSTRPIEASSDAISLRVLRLGDSEPWGRAAACAAGAQEATGDIIVWLDADCIASPTMLESHLLTHSVNPWSAAVSRLAFCSSREQQDYPSRHQLAAYVGTEGEAAFEALLGGLDHEVGTSLQEVIWRQIQSSPGYDPNAFRMFTGANGSMPRRLYEETGGFDPDMKLGEDTEIAYRIEAVGGRTVLVERGQPTIHIGADTTSVRTKEVRRVNDPFFAQRIPKPIHRRLPTIARWQRPVAAVSLVRGTAPWDWQKVVDTTERLLQGARSDIVVRLPPEVTLGQRWSGKDHPLEDPALTDILLTEWFRGEHRVLRDSEPDHPAFEVTFGANAVPRRDSLTRLIAYAEDRPPGETVVVACTIHDDATVRVMSAHAINRARRLGSGGDGTYPMPVYSLDAANVEVTCRECTGFGDYSLFSGATEEATRDPQ